MRLKPQELVIYRPGATRRVWRFLFLPDKLFINYGFQQWRWLEWAEIEQHWSGFSWVDIKFTNL